MNFNLKPEIKQALIDMNFVGKYEELSNKYSSKEVKLEDRLTNIDIDLILDMIGNSFDYSVSFDEREKFFKIEEMIQDGLIFGMNIILKGGTAEFIWVVRNDGELQLGRPWSNYSKEIIDRKYIIRLPAFRDYDELEKLLKESFEMYEEFKAILIKEYLG